MDIISVGTSMHGLNCRMVGIDETVTRKNIEYDVGTDQAQIRAAAYGLMISC